MTNIEKDLLIREIKPIEYSFLKGHRGKGIGNQLLIALIDRLKKNRLKRVSLSVDRENFAYGFYKNHGFTDYFVSGKSIIMTKELIET